MVQRLLVVAVLVLSSRIVAGLYIVGSGNAMAAEADAASELAPTVPSNLTAAVTGATTVRLSWTASSGATSYNVKRGTTSGGEVLLTSTASTTITDTGLSTGTRYYYVVSAVDFPDETANSNEASATPGRAVGSDFTGDFHADLGTFDPATGTWIITGLGNQSWGIAGDILVPADYTGAGRVQVAVFRPSNGYWYVKGGPSVQWGQAGDIPVPGDYTGAGLAQVAVFRPSNGYWYVKGGPSVQWGQAGDIPVPADYDGDGKVDIAVFRPSNGYWYVRNGVSEQFGGLNAIPVPADYNGDGKADLAYFSRATYYGSTGAGVPRWIVKGIGSFGVAIGTYTDLPVPQDLDGDGQTEFVVYRPSTGAYNIYFSATSTYQTIMAAPGQVPVALPVALRKGIDGDVDRDRRRDPAIYRPSTGDWWVQKSAGGYQNVVWGGLAGDVPVAGDYDGDGLMDAAIYRPSTGTWWLLFSATNYTTYQSVSWGLSTDVPVVGDFDGDGKTDIAVYRASTGIWWLLFSASGYTTYQAVQWGVSSDVPVVGDFDGDGKADITLYRPSNGTWWALLSSTGYSTYRSWNWGLSGDQPAVGDYDGDGTTDVAVYRPSDGTWWILFSSSGFTTWRMLQWGGGSAYTLVPGDYDGDGRTDLGLYNLPEGRWYLRLSSLRDPIGADYAGSQIVQWGVSTDIPVPSSPIPTASSTTINIVGINGSQSFSPNPASAKSGGMVMWRNSDGLTHRIVLDDNSYDSGNLAPQAVSPPLPVGAVGAAYHCSIHPSMVGTITVPQ